MGRRNDTKYPRSTLVAGTKTCAGTDDPDLEPLNAVESQQRSAEEAEPEVDQEIPENWLDPKPLDPTGR
jgi:hypothetical protein